jgi:hypothetical protein
VTSVEPSYKQVDSTDPSKSGEFVQVPDKDNFLHSHQEPFTGLTTDQLQQMDQKITGKDISDQLIQNHTLQPTPSDGQTYCSSPEDLGQELANLKAQGKLPAIIQVDCGNEPFFSDSKGEHAGGVAAGHFVTVTDYQPGPPAKVSIDNQWGKGCDHSGDNALSLNELYRATVPPGSHEQITQLQTEIADAKAHGQPTTELDLELARQRHIAKDPHDKISNAEYEKEVKKAMVSAIDRWDKEEGNGTINEDERREAWVKFMGMATNIVQDSTDKGFKDTATAIRNELKKTRAHHHNMTDPAIYWRDFKAKVDE